MVFKQQRNKMMKHNNDKYDLGIVHLYGANDLLQSEMIQSF